jgi:hypothetical protein
MPHEGAAPGSPGAPHIPPYQPGPPPPADPEWPEGGPPGGGDQGGISRPDTGYIPFDPSESIFGWSWLGRWAEDDAPPEVAEFIKEWVLKFNQQVEDPNRVDPQTQLAFLEEFKVALSKESWWVEKTSVWQALQILEYGTGPGADYQRLIDSTREYVDAYAMQSGFGTTEFTDDEIRDLILDAGTISQGVIVIDPTGADSWIDLKLVGERTPEDEGAVGVGAGTIQDLYNKYKSIADANFTDVDSETLWDIVGQVKREELSEAGAYERIINQTAGQYDWLSSSLVDKLQANNGVSLKTHLSPLRTAIRSTWELGEGEVELKDYLDNLIIPGAEGEDSRFMNSREARQWARNQDRFKETNQYKSNMSTLTSSIFSMFGAR